MHLKKLTWIDRIDGIKKLNFCSFMSFILFILSIHVNNFFRKYSSWEIFSCELPKTKFSVLNDVEFMEK
jgi:hypothetical protein